MAAALPALAPGARPWWVQSSDHAAGTRARSGLASGGPGALEARARVRRLGALLKRQAGDPEIRLPETASAPGMSQTGCAEMLREAGAPLPSGAEDWEQTQWSALHLRVLAARALVPASEPALS